MNPEGYGTVYKLINMLTGKDRDGGLYGVGRRVLCLWSMSGDEKR